MSKEEAIRLIKIAYPNKEIGNVVEKEKYFVIELLPKMPGNGFLRPVTSDDGLKGVEKQTGKIFTYNPMRPI